MSLRPRARLVVRAALASTLSLSVVVSAAPPLAYAATEESRGRDEQPKPAFLQPGTRPESSTVRPGVTPEPKRPEPAKATIPPKPRWETHADSRPTTADARSLARASGRRVLVTASMTEDTTEFANPDDTTTMEITSGPSRVRRGNGWADVDPTLVHRGDHLEAAAIVGSLRLTNGGSRELATLGKGRHEVGLDWPTDLPEPVVNGATATYPGALPGGDVVVRALRYGFEQSVVLHRRPAGTLSYELALRLPAGQNARQAGNDVELTDRDGAVIGRLPQALMFDAERDGRTLEPLAQVPVSTRLVERDGRLFVRYAPSASFLDAATTVYPVTIDPVVTLSVSSDTDVVNNAFADSAYSGNTYLRVGTSTGANIGRAYLTFNTSSFANKNISDATLTLHQLVATTCVPSIVRVHRATSVSNSATTWNNKPGYVVAASDPSPSFAHGTTGCAAADEAIDATDLFQTIAGIGNASSAVMLKAVSETDPVAYKRFASGNDGTNPPSLAVTYTTNTVPTVTDQLPNHNSLVPTETPTLSGTVSDPDGGTVTAEFYVKNAAGDWVTNGSKRTGAAGSVISYTVEDGKMSADQTYSWYMRGCDAAGTCSLNTSPQRNVTVSLRPGMTADAFANAGDQTVSLWWTAPTYTGGTSITSYTWILRDVTTGEEIETGTSPVVRGQSNPLTHAAVNGHYYFWWITANNSYGAGESRKTGSVLASAVPSAPPNVVATAGNTTSKVTWGAAQGNGDSVAYYTAKLYEKNVTEPVDTELWAAALLPYEYTATGLTNGTTYYWTVSAWNSRGDGPVSTSAEVVPATVPGPPRDVTANEQTRPAYVLDPANPAPDAAVTVGWDTPASNGGAAVTEYVINVYENGQATPSKTVTALAADRSKQVTGLKPNMPYVFKVRARNRVDVGAEAAAPGLTTHSTPTVTKTVEYGVPALLMDGTRRVSAPGDTVRYTITLTNAQSQTAELTSVSDSLPAGVETGSITVDGQPCGSACGRTGDNITLSAGTLAADATRTYQYTAILSPGERACLANAVNTVVAQTAYGLHRATAATTTCGSALGIEPWWSYLSQSVGAQSTASVNVANGNLVVQATDSTAVQAHGHLAYVLRRSYNSQSVNAVDLPGSLGTGWMLNAGHASDLAGGGISATGLQVPRLGDTVDQLTEPLSVTLVDRDGTRHLFKPKVLTAIGVAGLTGTSAALQPSVLNATGRSVCADVAYQAPAGVHLGLWRYVSVVTPADPSAACTDIATRSPRVLGYAAMRPDRLRTEFNEFGQLVEMRDGAGVALRYTYEPVTSGQPGRLLSVYEPRSCTPGGTPPAPCRELRFAYPSALVTNVTDPAGRVTRYEFGTVALAGVPGGTVKVLHRVVNPPETAGGSADHVDYSYQSDTATGFGPTACGGSFLQLCSVTDARGARTTFTYDTAGSAAAGLATLGRIVKVTDRRLAETVVTYPSATRTIATRGGTQQRAFSGIDDHGRVGEITEGSVGDIDSTTYEALHFTTQHWDTSGCVQPSDRTDHNLCRVVRWGPGSSGTRVASEDTRWVYNEQGMVLRERRYTGASAYADTTFGYRTQYHGSTSGTRSTEVGTDVVSGGGNVTSTRPTALATMTSLFAVSDRTESVTPRGNVTAAPYARHRTQWVVDSDKEVAPGAVPTGGVCPRPTGQTQPGAGNTGLVCAEIKPYGGTEADGPVATTKSEYDAFGQKTAMRTPRGGEYLYTYYGDADKDLSLGVSAGGWLKTVTDPAGEFVGYGYDRAGNLVRTWDRDATARIGGVTPATFDPATATGHSETLFAPGSFTAAVAAPWRYVRAKSTPKGDVTTFEVDAHGNVERLVPPRSHADTSVVSAATDPYDTISEYDDEGHVTSVQRGQEPARTFQYDVFGNLTVQRDQSTTATVMAYDLVNRLVERTTPRGPFPATQGDRPAGCATAATTSSSPYGAGQLVCSELMTYDTVDNVVTTTDKDGQTTTVTYDMAHRKTAQVAPRLGAVKTRTEWRYDADGNVLTTCAPRQFTEDSSGCTATSVHATHVEYDVAGRAVTTTAYRKAGEPLVTRTTYDAEGNATDVTSPRAEVETAVDHKTEQTFDLLGRRTTVDAPRAGITTYHYSPSGDVLAVVAPGATGDNVGLNGAGRDVRITGYTYDENHRVVDTVTALQVAAADPAANTAAVVDAIDDAVTNEVAQTNLRTRSVYDPHGNVAAVYGPRAFAAGTVAAPDKRFMLSRTFDKSDRPVAQSVPRAASGIADDLTSNTTQLAQCPAVGANHPLGYPEGTQLCTSTMAYDADGRAVEVTLPSATADATPRRLFYEYTEDNLVTKTKAPDPRVAPDGAAPANLDDILVDVSTVLHDGSGRPVRTTNAAGHATVTTYTADGLVSRVVGPTAGGVTHETEFEYDANGNRTKEITPRAADRPHTETTYFADNLVEAVYAGGNDLTVPVRGDVVTTYEYDKAGNPAKVWSPSANATAGAFPSKHPTSNTFTPDNLVLTTTQPVVVTAGGVQQARLTTYAYDAAGRKTSVDVDLTGTPAANGAPQTFGYYPTGQLETETGRGGTDTITRKYDANGALVEATASDGTTTRTTTASYYLDGLPRQVVSDGRVTAYAYDGTGTRTSLGEGDNGGALTTATYTVNDAGLPLTMTAPDAGTISWEYDELGRPVTESRGDRTQIWKYRGDDLLGSTAVTSTPSLAESVRAGTATADLASFSYEYDELGRQTAQTYYGKAATSPVGDVAAAAPVTYDYAYDRTGRLSSFTDARGTRTIQHDPNGNRTAYGTLLQPDATSFTYRADDSIASSTTGTTTRTYTYGEPFGGVTDDGCAAYAYDGMDRLEAVDGRTALGCATGDASYAYDALDRQVSRTGGGETVHMDYDGTGSTVLRQTGATLGTLHYTVDPGGTVKTVRRAALGAEHLAEDGTGSTALVTTASSTVLCTARYDAYGSPDGNTALAPAASCNTGTTQSDVFYRGNRKDAATGQYQLGSRTYDPAKASFLTPDVYRTGGSDENLGVGTDPLTRNTYGYVNGDPINYTDPSGHEPRPLQDGSGWTGNGCTSGCTGDDNRERRVLQEKAAPGINPEVEALLQSLDDYKKRNKHGYWDAVGRECSATHAPLQSPGNLECEQNYRASLVNSLLNPEQNEIGAMLGFYDAKHCFAEGKWKGCAALAGKIALLAGPKFLRMRATAVGRGSGAMRPLTVAERTTLDDALRAQKLDHVFVPKHDLDALVQQFGSREAAMEQIVRSIGGPLPQAGTFEIAQSVGGQLVVIRGAVVNGVPRIGTVFTP